MESRTRIIPVKVNNDITVMVEAKDLGGGNRFVPHESKNRYKLNSL